MSTHCVQFVQKWSLKGDFRIRGGVTEAIKYVDNLVLLAKKEETQQDIFVRLVQTGRNYKMGVTVDKSK